jgi:hypothetical protein
VSDENSENAAVSMGASQVFPGSDADTPLPAVFNGGKDPANGRFLPGNRLAVGNNLGKKTSRFRSLLFRAVTDEDFAEVTRQLIVKARQGERWACQLLLSYLCGSPETILNDRLLILERLILRGEEEL